MKILNKYLKRPLVRRKRETPICLFCYHKVGTVLLSKVFRDICEDNAWTFEVLHGKHTDIPKGTDVAVFSHSLIDPKQISSPFLGVHLIRDPRDIIVSGYQYHCRTKEQWCTNKDFSTEAPIRFPKVPYSQQHRTEEWKTAYLHSLNGKSYQETISGLSQSEGLMFELKHYGAWTIESMLEWDYDADNILEIKFEDLMGSFTSTFRSIFEHLDFSESEVSRNLEMADTHNIKRKSVADIDKMKHVTSTKTSRWRDYFEDGHKAVFRDRFKSALVDLGYETDDSW